MELLERGFTAQELALYIRENRYNNSELLDSLFQETVVLTFQINGEIAEFSCVLEDFEETPLRLPPRRPEPPTHREFDDDVEWMDYREEMENYRYEIANGNFSPENVYNSFRSLDGLYTIDITIFPEREHVIISLMNEELVGHQRYEIPSHDLFYELESMRDARIAAALSRMGNPLAGGLRRRRRSRRKISL